MAIVGRGSAQAEPGAWWESLDAADALFGVDEELRIVSWNRGAERLTGTCAEDAIGRRCWEVLGGARGPGACRRSCPYARLVRRRWPVPSHEGTIRTARGPRRVVFSTLAVRGRGRRLFLHLVREVDRPVPLPSRAAEPAALSPRQLEVLQLLASGLRAKDVAATLGLTLVTVRNHVRAILVRLGCHSQLEAVVTARRAGLIADPP